MSTNESKKSVLSVAKMSPEELKEYTSRLGEILSGSSASAIRICECCINISIDGAPSPSK